MKWARNYANARGGQQRRLAVMGDSAGGNLAAGIAHRLHSAGAGELTLAAQFLLYPILDVSKPHSAYPSRMQFGGGDYLLTRDSIDATVKWYLDGVARPDDPGVSPLLLEDTSILPPTVIVTAGHDPLLDEARHYAERLQAAGVPTRFKCFDSTIHGFLSFGVLDVARQGRVHVAEEVRRCLFQSG